MARGHMLLSRACARLPVRLVMFSVLALVATWPLLRTASEMNLFRDAQVLLPYERNAAWSVLRWGQAPLWDPYYCGGLYALGTPQSRFVSPTFLLSLLFGAQRAEPVIAFAMSVLGMEGMYRYAKARGFGGLGAVLAAPVFALSGNFATASFFGWTNFFGFVLLPWATWGVRTALRGSARGLVVGALSLAWIAGFGGTYAGPMAALLCSYEVIVMLVRRIRRPRKLPGLLGIASVCALLSIGLAAVRLWPVTETLVMAPRVIGGSPGMGWPEMLRALTGIVEFPYGEWKTDNGAFLVGWMIVPALLAGALRRKSIAVVLLASLCIWAATGHAHGWSPFVGLKELPIYSVLRVPQRYLILFGFAAAVLAAAGVRILEVRSRRRAFWVVPLLVASAALITDTYALIHNHYAAAASRKLTQAPAQLDRDFHQARGNRWAAEYYAPMSRGSLSCWEAYPVPQSTLLRGDLQQEEYLDDSSAGSVHRTRWSPNVIELDVDLQRDAQLRVNQNWHPGWRCNVGQVAQVEGLLAVDLPAGIHHVRLRFLPRSAIGGLLATLAAIAGVVFIAWRWRGRAPCSLTDGLQLGAVAMAPFAVAGLTLAIVREPFPGRPPPRAPNGEIILADAPAPEATPIGAQFNTSAILEAGRMNRASLRSGDVMTVELDWRLTARMPPHTSVFVHLESPAGGQYRADHSLLSAWVDFQNAPVGPLIRDFAPWIVPDKAQPGEWKVWAGLFKDGPGGFRYGVADGGKAKVQQNRVLVGTFRVE